MRNGPVGKRILWLVFSTVTFARSLACQQVEVQVTTNIRYGTAEGKPLLLDVFQSSEHSARPAILFLHGGGWIGGDKSQFYDLAKAFAQQGYVCFGVNYRLMYGTKDRFPAQLDDVQLAVRWIRAHATQYGIQKNHIAAFGSSAGGHLAALLGVLKTSNAVPIPFHIYSSRVQCVVDLNGPTDLTVKFPASQQLIHNFLGGTQEEKPDNYRTASPIFHINEQSAHFLIFHGSLDANVPVDQSRRFVHALQEKAISVTYIEFPDEAHGIDKPANQQIFLNTTTQFLQFCLR